MRYLIALVLVLAATATALAFVGDVGSAHVAAGTSNFTRSFPYGDGAKNLVVYPHTADIVIILQPAAALAESMTIRAGVMFPFEDLDPPITGFDVIRTGSTLVDVWWW